MLLAQKPQPINFGRHHHRRHPASLSSIAVVAHPTNTPGLLSLSKPLRPPSRHPPRPQSPRFPRNRFHRPTASVSVAEFPSNTISTLDPARGRPCLPTKAQSDQSRSAQVQSTDTVVPAIPEPAEPQQGASPEPPTLVAQPTGRLARSRRSRHRSTPAVAKSSVSPERSKATRAPSPAKKFEPSAPIPVPERRRGQSPSHKILSRSDPLSKLTIHTNFSAQHKPGRQEKRRKNRVKRNADEGHLPLAEWDFPAPASSDDEGEGDDDDPVTPIRQTGSNDKAWHAVFHEGPKTAPLPPSVNQGQFTFFTFPLRSNPASPVRTSTPPYNIILGPTTPNKQVRPEHRRAPSQPASFTRGNAVETVFHLSEDEADVLPAGADVHEKMALLFGNGNSSGSGSPLFPSTGTPSPSPRKHKTPRDRERYV